MQPLTSQRRIVVPDVPGAFILVVSHPSRRPRLDRNVERMIIELLRNGFHAGSITRTDSGLGLDWYPVHPAS